MVKKVTIAKATASLADHVRKLNGEVLVLTESGQPVAALVPIQDMDMGNARGRNESTIPRNHRARQTAASTRRGHSD
jgi:antitoxin (DNA-binding transcriptional repressor) of toxin-antitoxin stability system